MNRWRVEAYLTAGKCIGCYVVRGNPDKPEVALNGIFLIDLFYVAEPWARAIALAAQLNAETQ